MKSMNNMNLLELWRSVISDVVSADRPDLTLRQQAILLNVYLRPQPHTVRGLAHSEHYETGRNARAGHAVQP